MKVESEQELTDLVVIDTPANHDHLRSSIRESVTSISFVSDNLSKTDEELVVPQSILRPTTKSTTKSASLVTIPLISASTQEQPEVIAPKKRGRPPMTEEQKEEAKRKRLEDKQKKT